MRTLPYGPRAVLVEFDSLEEVMAAAVVWRSDPPSGVSEVVPAARTILLVHDGTLDTAALATGVRGWSETAELATHRQQPCGREVVVAVHYNGADLDGVASACGLGIDEVVRRHAAASYTVAFCGFMPGFAYLIGLPPELRLPRRSTPRTMVPAGSVAIAAEYCGVYPTQSPGGWHLLGRTDATLWDDMLDQPALLSPGTRVRFVAT